MATEKKEDWADRRARDFFDEHMPSSSCLVANEIEETDRDWLIEKLAANFRSLAASCEPRSVLDM